IFANYSSGVKTNRDAWCYNADKVVVASNMQRMIAFYNAEVARWAAVRAAGVDIPELKDFINFDPTKISWSHTLLQPLDKGKVFTFETSAITASLYRPFTQQWLYFSRAFNEGIYQMPQLFPTAAAENRVICVSGIGARSGFSTLITNFIPCLDNIEKGQCFPLYLYAKPTTATANDLFAAAPERSDAITDAALAHFCNYYTVTTISKEDIFYYVYGLLHSPDYRHRYAA
ncbi:hypothetical protein TI04_13600, partial [Achromatium sp. WMS2]